MAATTTPRARDRTRSRSCGRFPFECGDPSCLGWPNRVRSCVATRSTILLLFSCRRCYLAVTRTRVPGAVVDVSIELTRERRESEAVAFYAERRRIHRSLVNLPSDFRIDSKSLILRSEAKRRPSPSLRLSLSRNSTSHR